MYICRTLHPIFRKIYVLHVHTEYFRNLCQIGGKVPTNTHISTVSSAINLAFNSIKLEMLSLAINNKKSKKNPYV